jgi:hypothetical protein
MSSVTYLHHQFDLRSTYFRAFSNALSTRAPASYMSSSAVKKLKKAGRRRFKHQLTMKQMIEGNTHSRYPQIHRTPPSSSHQAEERVSRGCACRLSICEVSMLG